MLFTGTSQSGKYNKHQAPEAQRVQMASCLGAAQPPTQPGVQEGRAPALKSDPQWPPSCLPPKPDLHFAFQAAGHHSHTAPHSSHSRIYLSIWQALCKEGGFTAVLLRLWRAGDLKKPSPTVEQDHFNKTPAS